MEKLIKEILAFRDEREWKQFHTPVNIAKSISIESAELLECFQWNNEFDEQQVKEELADVLIYCILMADATDLDINTIIKEKLNINREKYPVEKCKGNCKKYNELED
ncbi:MAG: nucleotide pyrophosphohydrolase [Peptostreptococcaceae bacterium]|nr:nucleotide pyrophosphohydrolase [Peptostreptococcaceae bacterium]